MTLLISHRPVLTSARQRSSFITVQAPVATQTQPRQRKDVQKAKDILALEVVGTNRGGATSSLQRAAVAEAQIALESLSQGIDFDLLEGLWELVYTTAPDVAPLIGAGGNAPLTSLLSPFHTGKVFQRFTSLAEGRVDNIIQLSVPYVLQPERGITLRVRAEYALRSASRLKLRFRELGVDKVRISDLSERILAPAVLPRGWLQHRILLGLHEFNFQIPLRSSESSSAAIERNVGNEYLLTFLDADMLIGRQTGSGGTFIFRRADDNQQL